MPPRGRARKTEHIERWILHKALSILEQNGQISFPISIEKSEKPDFLIKMSECGYGVELTEIIHSDYARLQTLPEAQHESAVLDPSLFKWEQPKRCTEQLKEIAAREKLTGRPWMGDSVEIEFAQSIFDTIEKKNKKLNSHYKRCDIDVLLVYHNQSTPALEYLKGLEYTSEKLEGYWNKGFSLIIVIKYEALFMFSKTFSTLFEAKS